ncbi:hypothetical protein EV196_10264 [Mariniflexile fucanivorans]|uniref:PD-(D/E)XK nuclease superfamily protein n=1 Tax=Mariniflexile fucanivorans TaxID=264023 RepID=A0A4R1RMK8_9FLAO|nr:hypothetical protein [Mariniflexile fucanivorans]TCL67508.1 hypothetical protein EV196_10264 [Mariniflexile fucanivorans]
MSTKTEKYQKGNNWQKHAYSKMSDYFQDKGVSEFSIPVGGKTPYKHLLTESDSKLNFINEAIYNAVIERFSSHKAGDQKRVKINTVASQTYCFNLFVPLQLNLALASRLFSTLLDKNVEVKHIEIEFTPNQLDSIKEFERHGKDESIGDQAAYAGTDADVAVFYKDSKEKKGVILIEFKFIEAEFSMCSSYKKEEVPAICNTSNFWDLMVESKKVNSKGKLLCGYNKYDNWKLTQTSECFDVQKIRDSNVCPFRFSLNQLWRNMLLSEKVKEARQLNESHFWVFSPKQNNDFLWNNHGENIEFQFKSFLSEKGNERFKKYSLEAIISILDTLDLSLAESVWLNELKDRYFI